MSSKFVGYGVKAIKNLIKGGKQKTTGTEVVNPFKFKPAKSKLEKAVKKLEIDTAQQKGRTKKIIQKMEQSIEPARTNLRQTTQKMAGEPVTKSGFSKGKDIKKAKGGRIGRKGGGDLGMQSVKYGLDNNPNITAADPKAKFIAANKKNKKSKKKVI